MADYTRYIETTTKVVYRLPSPTNWTEVSKVFAAIQNDAKAKNHRFKDYDDFVTIEGDEEEIRFIIAVDSVSERM